MEKENKLEMQKIRTGISILDDEIMKGGIPKGHRILVTGTTGTLKSTFCFHILHQAALDGMNGAFISLEQSADSMLQQMMEMKYDFGKIVLDSNNIEAIKSFIQKSAGQKKQGVIQLIDIGFERKKLTTTKSRMKFSWLDALEQKLEQMKKTVKPEIIVLDSLNILYHLDKDKFADKRRDLFYVIDYLRDLKVTSLIINEIPAGDDRYSQYGIESYLVDGVIQLSQRRRELDVVRELHIVKMRSVDHSLKVYTFQFDKNEKFKIRKKIASE